jgi:hypothetical protein
MAGKHVQKTTYTKQPKKRTGIKHHTTWNEDDDVSDESEEWLNFGGKFGSASQIPGMMVRVPAGFDTMVRENFIFHWHLMTHGTTPYILTSSFYLDGADRQPAVYWKWSQCSAVQYYHGSNSHRVNSPTAIMSWISMVKDCQIICFIYPLGG